MHPIVFFTSNQLIGDKKSCAQTGHYEEYFSITKIQKSDCSVVHIKQYPIYLHLNIKKNLVLTKSRSKNLCLAKIALLNFMLLSTVTYKII